MKRCYQVMDDLGCWMKIAVDEMSDGYAAPIAGRMPTIMAADGINRVSAGIKYDALDAVSNSPTDPDYLEFRSAALNAGDGGNILSAEIHTNAPACIARFRLHLFSSPPKPVADNAPLPMNWSERATHCGAIDFPAMHSEGSGSTAAYSLVTSGEGNLPRPVVSDTTGSVFGLLETLDDFNAKPDQSFYIRIDVEPT